MPKWNFNGKIDDEFEFDDDFDVTDEYTPFQKIGRRNRGEEEKRDAKKRNSVKHQPREDKR